MTPRPGSALLAALAAALLAVCLGPAPGAAAVPAGLGNVTCATGAITAAPVSGKVVTLKGWIKPCAAAAPVASYQHFAIGWYDWAGGGHHAWITNPTSFQVSADPTKTVTTDFSLPVDFTGYTPALCLAYYFGARLSCVNVSWSNGVAVAKPLPTTDPKVSLLLAYEPQPVPDGQAVQKCGTCW